MICHSFDIYNYCKKKNILKFLIMNIFQFITENNKSIDQYQSIKLTIVMKFPALWFCGMILWIGSSSRVHAWGGLFNRFSPEMLSNMGYGSSHGSHGSSYRPPQPLFQVNRNNLRMRTIYWKHLLIIRYKFIDVFTHACIRSPQG